MDAPFSELSFKNVRKFPLHHPNGNASAVSRAVRY